MQESAVGPTLNGSDFKGIEIIGGGEGKNTPSAFAETENLLHLISRSLLSSSCRLNRGIVHGFCKLVPIANYRASARRLAALDGNR